MLTQLNNPEYPVYDAIKKRKFSFNQTSALYISAIFSQLETLFLDTGTFTATLTQVVKFCTAHFT